MVPQRGLYIYPNETISVTRLVFSALKSFVLILYTIPLGNWRKQLNNHVRKYILLGYKATESNIYYWGLLKNLIKTYKNVIFDEGMNGLEYQKLMINN